MFKFIPFLLLFCFINTSSAQYDWTKISYNHSYESMKDNSKKYYTIKFNVNGEGSLEYFANGKANIKEFNISRKNLSFINSKLRKSGIFRIDPEDLLSKDQQSVGTIYTMTVTLDDEFGENYRYKFDRSKLPPKRGETNKDKDKEEDEGEKKQVIPIPNNLKPEYKKQFYNLYYDLEMIVPNRIWKEANEVLDK